MEKMKVTSKSACESHLNQAVGRKEITQPGASERVTACLHSRNYTLKHKEDVAFQTALVFQ